MNTEPSLLRRSAPAFLGVIAAVVVLFLAYVCIPGVRSLLAGAQNDVDARRVAQLSEQYAREHELDEWVKRVTLDCTEFPHQIEALARARGGIEAQKDYFLHFMAIHSRVGRPLSIAKAMDEFDRLIAAGRKPSEAYDEVSKLPQFAAGR